MFSNQFAEREFRSVIEECLDRQGWQVPDRLCDNTVRILVDKLDKNPWTPEPSFAECYLQVQTAAAAVALGDTCWFARAVFPDYALRRGITSSYYVQLGQSCYDRALTTTNNEVLKAMRDHFEFLAEIAHTALWSKGGFRSMWE